MVVFQFSVAVIFIVSVVVVYKQIEFVQHKNLGYDRDNVLYFEIEGSLSTNPEGFISEIKKIPGIVNASGMLGNIISSQGGGGMPGEIKWKGKAHYHA